MRIIFDKLKHISKKGSKENDEILISFCNYYSKESLL